MILGFQSYGMNYELNIWCWWFRNPANQLIWWTSHCLQGVLYIYKYYIIYIYPRWLFGISSNRVSSFSSEARGSFEPLFWEFTPGPKRRRHSPTMKNQGATDLFWGRFDEKVSRVEIKFKYSTWVWWCDIYIYNALCFMFKYITIYIIIILYIIFRCFHLLLETKRFSGEGNLVIARNRSLLWRSLRWSRLPSIPANHQSTYQHVI